MPLVRLPARLVIRFEGVEEEEEEDDDARAKLNRSIGSFSLFLFEGRGGVARVILLYL